MRTHIKADMASKDALKSEGFEISGGEVTTRPDIDCGIIASGSAFYFHKVAIV